MIQTRDNTRALFGHFSDDQVRTLGFLVHHLAEGGPDDEEPQRLSLAQALASLARVHVVDPVPTREVTVRVEGISADRIYGDVEYNHLFDTGQYVEAFAHEISLERGTRVVVIYATDDMAVSLAMREEDDHFYALVTVYAGSRAEISAAVRRWEDTYVQEAVDQASALLRLLPKRCADRALAAVQSQLATP